LAEDDDSVRKLARFVIEGQGYQVLEARCGSEALELSDQHQGQIHLLVTDVIMPRMSGPQLAEHLVKKRPETKALFLSGYTGEAMAHRGILDEGVAFLQKPFAPDALARKIREVLDRASM